MRDGGTEPGPAGAAGGVTHYLAGRPTGVLTSVNADRAAPGEDPVEGCAVGT
jgi:hypothetical protein